MDRYLSNQIIFPLISLFSLTAFLAHTLFTKTAVFSDGRFYYSITRSLIKDKDIKFSHEFENLGITPTYTRNVYVWNKYPPGVSFFWMPLFFITDGFLYLINSVGTLGTHWGWITLDTLGYGLIYQATVAISSIYLGVLGLFLMYQLLKEYFLEKTSLIATIMLFTTTNLLFYIAVEPISSHAVSFFVSSLFVYYFLRHQNDKYYYLILGIIGGIAGLVRTQDSLILITPILQIPFKFRKTIKLMATGYWLLVTGFFIGFLPQIIFWKKLFNTFWYSPYLEEGFNFIKPQVLHVLFNNQNGLLTITPSIGIAFLGLIIIFLSIPKSFKSLEFRISGNKWLPNISHYALLYFVVQLCLISSWSGFYQGGSYSIRMMVTTYPLLAFGLAQTIELVTKKIKLNKVYIIVGAVTLLNIILIIRYLISF